MLKRDLRDILAGSFVSMVGLFFAIAGTNYTFGTAARMGPGYMPVVLGWVLCILGLLILVPALFRQGEKIEVHWDSLAASTAALITFAFTQRDCCFDCQFAKTYAFWRAWRIGHIDCCYHFPDLYCRIGYDCFPVSSAVNHGITE